MTADLTGYETYLKSKRFSKSTIMDALRLTRKLHSKCTDDDIRNKDADKIISEMGWSPSTTASRHWYRYHINQYKSYLKIQEKSA